MLTGKYPLYPSGLDIVLYLIHHNGIGVPWDLGERTPKGLYGLGPPGPCQPLVVVLMEGRKY